MIARKIETKNLELIDDSEGVKFSHLRHANTNFIFSA
jgi:hypothetical protein